MIPANLARFATPTRVLDHGHVFLVDVLGGDDAVEADARISVEGGRPVSDTRSLLRYLMRQHHTSPFEQSCIKLDIKLPIFVARQLVRYRTAKLNEVSGRYGVLPEEWYTPDAVDVCEQAKDNKQGRAGPVAGDTAETFIAIHDGNAQRSFDDYHAAIDDGIAFETARIGLPLATYTHWRVTFDLHNLLHMLQLRMDPHAQYEIRVYADAIAAIVKEWAPLTWEAFEDYRLNAHTFSGQEMAVLRNALVGFDTDILTSMLRHRGVSKREIGVFLKTLGLNQ